MDNSSKDDLKNLLLKTQKKLSEVESVARIGTWEYHFETKELVWSDQMFRIFKLHPDTKITFETINERIHFADRFHWDLLINRASIDGSAGEIVIRLLDEDNDVSWIRKTAKGVFENQVLISVRGFCQDITEMKRLEAHYEMTKNILEK